MDNQISIQKIVLSFILTSTVVFAFSVLADGAGLYGDNIALGTGSQSNMVFSLFQLLVVCLANAVLHVFFYFGNLESSPIAKGLGLGAMIALSYFMISILGVGMFDVKEESLDMLAAALGGRMFEYCSGGLVTAAISVTDIHKWGFS